MSGQASTPTPTPMPATTRPSPKGCEIGDKGDPGSMLVLCCAASLLHCFIASSLHCFIASVLHCNKFARGKTLLAAQVHLEARRGSDAARQTPWSEEIAMSFLNHMEVNPLQYPRSMA
jgi:hypothetical protein